jgi:recombinational DNA repair ATPase RecF
MTQVSLRQWSGAFGSDAVIAKIRRVIVYHLAFEECVLVLDDGAVGLDDEVRRKLMEGWPEGKVLWSNTHPTLGGRQSPSKRRRRFQ